MRLAHRNVRASDSGSVLVEVTVGMGLLAVALAAAAAVSSATSVASAAAAERAAAVRAAGDGYEVLAAGGTLGDDTLIVTRLSMPGAHDPCAQVDGAGVSSARVEVPLHARPGRVGVVGPVPALHGSAPLLVTVGSDVPTGTTAELRPAGGPTSGTSVDVLAGRCLAVDAPHGAWEIVLGGTSDLVDGLHRPVPQRPLALDVLEVASRRRWGLALSATLSVDIVADGARLPDILPPAGIRWYVRGDDLRTGLPSGAARAVHPGQVTAVASVCGDPESKGSTATAELAPGEQRSIEVRLATVVLRGVGHAPDATVQLVRDRACGDGSVTIAELSWVGGLTEGMRIAVPHGTWTAVLRVPQVTQERFAVVVTEGDEVEVELR